jgi:drug/metabolite transporter (DMT)-like permease
MSPTALALVLLAALIHAGWNIVAKRAGGGTHFVALGAVMIFVLWSPLGLWVAWQQVPGWGALQWGLVLASSAAHLLYFNALLKGYRESDLTVVYPVARGSGPLLSSAAAVLLLGEAVTAGTVAGVLGIALGIFLIAGGPGLWQRAHDPLQRQRVRAGLTWGGITGALIALYTVIDGYAVKVVAMSPILVDWLGNALRIPLMAPAVWRERTTLREALRTQWKAALVLAVFSPVAYVLVLYAVQMAPLSHVAPAREVSMLFAALIGGRLLGEADRGARLLGAACMAAGVVALAW